MRDEAPDFDTASRPELADGLRASCYGNIRAALQALGGDRQPPRNSPAEAMNEARATARADIALEPLLHTYRIGHAVVLERFFALIEELDLSPAQRHSATLIGSKYLFAYVDRVVGEVSEEYTSRTPAGPAQQHPAARPTRPRRARRGEHRQRRNSATASNRSISRSSPPGRPPTRPCATWRAGWSAVCSRSR